MEDTAVPGVSVHKRAGESVCGSCEDFLGRDDKWDVAFTDRF